MRSNLDAIIHIMFGGDASLHIILKTPYQQCLEVRTTWLRAVFQHTVLGKLIIEGWMKMKQGWRFQQDNEDPQYTVKPKKSYIGFRERKLGS